jgi:DHA1 family bicyclomycin/chloramphenicol resistance-like MFS transporter
MLAGLPMLAVSNAFDGRPPLMLLLLFGFAAFFSIGILNAMAMGSLGQVAGLGASLIASGSSLVASLFAVGLGPFYESVLAGGVFLAGAASLNVSLLLVTECRRRSSVVRAPLSALVNYMMSLPQWNA